MAGVLDIQTTQSARISNLRAMHNPKAVRRHADEDIRRLKELARKENAVQVLHELDQSESVSDSDNSDLESELEYNGKAALVMQTVAFPDVDTRSGENSIDEKLGRAFTICNAKYRVSVEDLCSVFICVANIVFGQKWVGESDMVDKYSELPDVDDEEPAQERHRPTAQPRDETQPNPTLPPPPADPPRTPRGLGIDAGPASWLHLEQLTATIQLHNTNI